MNAVTVAPPAPLAYAELERLADSIAKSGLFGIKTKDQAVALMMIAHAEGRHPALAARDYDVINNRPAKKAEAMLRDFIQAGGRVEWHSLTDELADATFTHPQTGSVRIDWDTKRAQTAFGKKDMYSKFPRQMLRSRVVSEGVRTLWPLATSGMYVQEEVQDMPPAAPFEGTTLEHANGDEPEAPPQRAAAAATTRPPRVTERAPAARTDEQWQAWLKKLRDACAVLRTRQDIVDVAARPTVGDALADAAAPAFVKREISAILAENYARFKEDEEALPEVEIVGGDKLAAG